MIIVKNSKIHGLGLFTSEKISAGEKILVIRGEVINGDECERRETEEDNVYIFWKDDNCYIDVSKTEEIKYINHNCDFNCDIIEGDDESLLLIAYRNILPGEELTIDYGYDEIYQYCRCSKCMSEAA
jgi:uncharacterized protein